MFSFLMWFNWLVLSSVEALFTSESSALSADLYAEVSNAIEARMLGNVLKCLTSRSVVINMSCSWVFINMVVIFETVFSLIIIFLNCLWYEILMVNNSNKNYWFDIWDINKGSNEGEMFWLLMLLTIWCWLFWDCYKLENSKRFSSNNEGNDLENLQYLKLFWKSFICEWC